MRYKDRYCQEYTVKLERFLKENLIKYKITSPAFDRRFIIFYIYQDDPRNEKIQKLHYLQRSSINPITHLEFSQKERNKAKWLAIGGLYPIIEIINEKQSVKYSCGAISPSGDPWGYHREQYGPHSVKKSFSWKGRKCFVTADDGTQDIFINRPTMEFIKTQKLQGVKIIDILQNGIVSQEAFQLHTDNILPQEAFIPGHGEIEFLCPFCKKKQYGVRSSYQYHFYEKFFDKTQDIYITKTHFGQGTASPIYLISNRFYRLLFDNNLTIGAQFNPVSLH